MTIVEISEIQGIIVNTEKVRIVSREIRGVINFKIKKVKVFIDC